VRSKVGGRIYDTTRAKHLCGSGGGTFDNDLYQKPTGEFFIATRQRLLDGRPLGPEEDLAELLPDPDPDWRGIIADREAVRKRCKDKEFVTPVSREDALLWCIANQMPELFRQELLRLVKK
jgi:hypothetical protein